MDQALVNLGELATVLELSPVTIRKLIDRHADFPIEERGDHGRAYTFDARAVKRWLDGHREAADQAATARRAEIAQLQLELTGGAVADGQPTLTAKQRLEALEAAYAEAKWLEAKGALVRVEDVRDAVEQALGGLRAELMRLPDALARQLDLDREGRRRVEDLVRLALTGAAARLERLGGEADARAAA
jgi:phage terminase Nu1 subunit (DNA packaging protein)